jgi:hypothetical protein
MKKLIFCALFFITSLSLFAVENYDWLTYYTWHLDTGFYGPKEYIVLFRKIEILPGSILYHERLRNERFSLVYHQMDKIDKLFQLVDTLSNNVYNLEFGDNYNLLLRKWGNIPYPTRQQRVGTQVNKNFPLVGIWGSLPHLTEYRIVDPKDCFIYMELNEQSRHWAVREGTYLLKQIDESTFETVSPFPDGRLRLEVKDKKHINIVPLFTLPDGEKGSLDPLIIYHN